MKQKIGVVLQDEALKISGMDFLQKLKSGEFPRPPFSATMNIELHEISDGLAIFKAIPEFQFYNAIGTIHGGYIGTLLDSAMACAIQTQLRAGTAYTTLEFKVNFIRPIFEKTGPIFAHGKLIHCGRTVATAEGHLFDERGKLYAFATTTCTLIPNKDGSSE